jgi:hypothetical protein
MISGIIAQIGTLTPRGVIGPTRYYDDADGIMGPFIAFDYAVTQLLSSPFVSELDSIFAAIIPQAMNIGFLITDDFVFAPILKGDQVVTPMIYFDGDVLSLPSIAPVVAPGSVWPNIYNSDDAIFSAVVGLPGSVRPSLFGDFEMVFAPELSTPLTVLPGRHTESDSVFAPIVFRNFLFAPFVNDLDVFYPPARTSATVLGVSLVTDSDAIYAARSDVIATLFAGLATDTDAIYLLSLFGGNQIIDIDVMFDQEAFYIPVVVSGQPASFDGTAAAVSLSASKLSVTRTSTVANGGAISTTQKTAGKYYFEVTMAVTHGASDCPGLLSSTGSFNNMVGGIQCTALYRSTGNIFSNSANSGKTLGACTSGDVISFAIDLGARKAWLRKNGGNWNGLVLGSENPNTGIGGVVIQASSPMAPAVCFGGASGAINDQMVGNFGGTVSGTPFIYPAPVGFGIWTT